MTERMLIYIFIEKSPNIDMEMKYMDLIVSEIKWAENDFHERAFKIFSMSSTITLNGLYLIY